MKTFKIIFAFIALALAFASCEDDAEKAVLKTDVSCERS
jgi:hypothetical protein